MMDPGTNVSGSRPNNDLEKDCDPAAKPCTAYHQLPVHVSISINYCKSDVPKPHIARR